MTWRYVGIPSSEGARGVPNFSGVRRVKTNASNLVFTMRGEPGPAAFSRPGVLLSCLLFRFVSAACHIPHQQRALAFLRDSQQELRTHRVS